MPRSENISNIPDEFSEDNQALLLFNALVTTDQMRFSEAATPYRIMLGTSTEESDPSLTVLKAGYAFKGSGVYDEETHHWKAPLRLIRTITPKFIASNDKPEYVSLADDRLVEKLTVNGVFRVILHRSTSDETSKWAERAVSVGWKALSDRLRPAYAREVVSAFWETWGTSGLVNLIDADSKLEEKNRLMNAKGKPALNRALSKKARDILLLDSKKESGKYLLELLEEHGSLDTDPIIDVESMSHPVIARFISERMSTEKPFNDIAPSARRNMATLLLQNVLKRFTDNERDRHQLNAAAINGALFSSSTYSRVLPFKDLILLSNAITEKRNAQREEKERQQLLPIEDIGSANLINCGEAIFRILEITATTKQHIEENRNLAEIFDELMEPYYSSFKASRQITVADICARYPEASDDLVLKLKETAITDGYASASKYYKEVSKQYGSHVHSRKHKPGYGIIT